MLVLVLTPNSLTIRYIVYCQARCVLNDLITLYCVRYDPQLCACSAETIWHHVQRVSGTMQSINYGCVDFLVPARYLTLILMLDAGLSVVKSRSYL